MFIKTSAIALAILQITSLAQAATSTKSAAKESSTTLSNSRDYWKSFKSLVDPLNITIPEIKQTTSQDPTTQCTYYQPPSNFVFNEDEWPTPWETATSNGMTKTAEFKALYKSIDWTKAPKISVRKLNSDGSINMDNYDEDKDPDCWWSASTCTKPKLEGVNEDIYTCPEPETWGLTYDDGPNCSHNAFYDYLEQEKIKATMFYIGSNVVDWPYGAQRGQKAGHHIADHTWSHQLMTTLTNEEVLAELYYTQKAIKMVTGVTPIHWRPAFGDVDDRVRWIATQLGMTTVLWNLDTDDWAAGESETLETVQKTYEDFIEMGSNGTFKNSGQITLTHEIDNTTMALALEFLPKIRAAYKNVLDVATCMNITHPYHEQDVTITPFNATNATTTTAASTASVAAVSSAAPVAGETTIELAGASTTAPAAASNVAPAADSAPAADAAATTGATAAALANNLSTSAGVQVGPNSLLLAVFAVAAYFF